MRRGITVLLAVLLLFSQAVSENVQKAPDFTMEGYDGELSGRNWETNLFFSRMQEMTGVSFQFSQYTDQEKPVIPHMPAGILIVPQDIPVDDEQDHQGQYPDNRICHNGFLRIWHYGYPNERRKGYSGTV